MYNGMCPFVSTFPTQKTRFEKSQCPKPIWLRPKRNFLEKVAFWVCEENAQDGKGAQRSILENIHVRCSTIRWTLRAITKLPFISSQFSRLFLIPLISSLCSALISCYLSTQNHNSSQHIFQKRFHHNCWICSQHTPFPTCRERSEERRVGKECW